MRHLQNRSPRRRRAACRAACALSAVALAAGCAGRSGPPPPPPVQPGNLVARHHDQVCRADGQAPTTVRLAEILDTAGLRETLAAVRLDPPPLAPPWPAYEFVVHYDRWGRPVASDTWESSVAAPVAAALRDTLRTRTRVIPGGLLEGAAFRIRVGFGRPIEATLAAPVVCMPHIVHEGGMRPTGLPEHVRTHGGSTWARIEGEAVVAVRVTVGPDGSVRRVEPVRGDSTLVGRAEEVVRLLRFDPALRNGVPVEGILLQTFRFRAPSRPPAPPAPGPAPGPRP